MREATNPEKVKKHALSHVNHRVILPVYVPNLQGFYRDSINVVRLSLSSLFATITANTKVTVIDNNSCEEVKFLLMEFYNSGQIDRLILNSENRGKVESVLMEARGSFEEFITIADSDTFFNKNWINASIDIFLTYPKTGVVSPIPEPHLFLYQNYYCFIENFFRCKLRTNSILKPNELVEFYESINYIEKHPQYFELIKKRQFHVQKNGIVAILGATHQVATYRRAVFDEKIRKVDKVFGKSLEKFHLDNLSLRKRYWRLSTVGFYARHIGNVINKDYEIKANDEPYFFASLVQKNNNGKLHSEPMVAKYLSALIYQIFKRYVKS